MSAGPIETFIDRVIAWLESLWLDILGNLQILFRKRTGHTVSIVGMTSSGKTVAHHFLATGKLIHPDPTQGAEHKEAVFATLQLSGRRGDDPNDPKVKRVKVASTLDVSGDFRSYPSAWKRALEHPALVLMFFDARHFIADTKREAAPMRYRADLFEACKFAGSLIPPSHADAHTVLVATHADLVPGWKGTDITNGNVRDAITTDPLWLKIKAAIAANTEAPADFVVGSFYTKEWASDLLFRIFEAQR